MVSRIFGVHHSINHGRSTMYSVSRFMISYSQKEVQVRWYHVCNLSSCRQAANDKQASSKYTYMMTLMRFHLQTKNNRFSLVSLYIERVSLARSKGA